MRLKQYIIESTTIRNIINKLAKQYKTDSKYIAFVGATDEPKIKKRMYWFNILDKSHPQYKSTIVYKEPL